MRMHLRFGVALLLALPSAASAQTVFKAVFDGAQVVPPTASAGTALGWFAYDPVTGSMTYQVTASGFAPASTATLEVGQVG